MGSNYQEHQSIPQGFYLSYTLSAHTKCITRAAWSPNGNQLVSGSLDTSIGVWEANIGLKTRSIRGHVNPVHEVTVLRDGRTAISVSSDYTIKIWDLNTGKEIQSLKGHKDIVLSLAASLDGQVIISGSKDKTIKLWDIKSGETIQTFRDHRDSVYGLALTSDGRTIISASTDKTLKMWNLSSEEPLLTFKGHSNAVWDVAIMPHRDIFASASTDKTIRIWNMSTGSQLRILEGHTGYIVGISFSHDGSLMASKSLDGTVRIWRCDTWETIAILPEEYPIQEPSRPLFHPKDPTILATLSNDGLSLRLWRLNYDEILANIIESLSVNYTTAKIALVGKSGVGKTALGYRIAEGEYYQTSSTHGQQFWVVDALGFTRGDGTECEAVLWDFAGQQDYRLVHALFLDDVELALVLFDASDQQEPLKEVEFWIKQLTRQRENCKMILVASRIDRGSIALTPSDIEDFCRHHNISGGFVATSAFTGEGITKLINRIRNQISWDSMTATVTTQNFKRIKEYILALKGDVTRTSLLVDWNELRSLLESTDWNWEFTNAEMKTVVQHLQTHGYVTILRGSQGEETVLLAPDVLINLASSFVLEARRNQKGLGALEEEMVLRGAYDLPELNHLADMERYTLLDAAVALFVKSNICLRMVSETQTLLVFPSLINQKRPLIESSERIQGSYYMVRGAVEHVYPSLVVLLGYTNLFKRTNQWQNQAQYQMGDGEICGFQLVAEHEGVIELSLYFAKATPLYTQNMFEGLFERFLRQKDVKIVKYPRIVCPNDECREPYQEHNIVVKRINSGDKFMYCSTCGTKIVLSESAAGVSLTTDEHEIVEQEERVTRLRTVYAEKLTYLKRIVEHENRETPRSFISYAWGVKAHEKWVLRLATDLREAGVDVLLDHWDAPIGSDLNRFMSLIASDENTDFVIPVCTPLYLQKYENKSPKTGSAVAAEVDLINLRLVRGTEAERTTILPILLEGSDRESLPPLMRGKVYVDFRDENFYFIRLFDIVLRHYGIPRDHKAVIDLREELIAMIE